MLGNIPRGFIIVKYLPQTGVDTPIIPSTHSPMSRARKRPPHRRDRHYIADWRRAAGKTQAQVASEIGMTQAAISRIEAGKNPYSQDPIEKMARYFSGFAGDCTPAAMLVSPPGARITSAESAQVSQELARLHALREPARRRYLQELLRFLQVPAAPQLPLGSPAGATRSSARSALKKPPAPKTS